MTCRAAIFANRLRAILPPEAEPAQWTRFSTLAVVRSCQHWPDTVAMTIRTLVTERIEARVYPTRAEMGAAAAERFADRLRAALAAQGKVAAIFASAPSQNEFLSALRQAPGIDWTRVTAFHMDEYAGISADHPASFRRYIREHLLDLVPIGAFHEIRGDAPDAEAECARYSALLKETPPALVALGIGENGHLAFIDPPVCDFQDPRDVRVVELDNVCRMQQVHDGCFGSLDEVPRFAISLTIPVFMRTPHAVVTVPGPTKRKAVEAALHGPVTESCPGSILRRHPDAVLFLDSASAPEERA
jgi:glucosamine-6-phosphate deaminase